MEGAEFRAGKMFGEMICRAQNKIVFKAARGGSRRTLDRKRERFAEGQGERVAAARKCNQTFERVKTIGAAAKDVQGQIDFCRRAFGEDFWQGGCASQSRREKSGAHGLCGLK